MESVFERTAPHPSWPPSIRDEWQAVLDHNAFDVTVMHALLKWVKD
jgi:hypothetical protein